MGSIGHERGPRDLRDTISWFGGNEGGWEEMKSIPSPGVGGLDFTTQIPSLCILVESHILHLIAEYFQLDFTYMNKPPRSFHRYRPFHHPGQWTSISNILLSSPFSSTRTSEPLIKFNGPGFILGFVGNLYPFRLSKPVYWRRSIESPWPSLPWFSGVLSLDSVVMARDRKCRSSPVGIPASRWTLK